VVISGATNQTYSASVAGNYKVVVTNSNNCIATSSVVPVTIIPNPEANFTSTVSVILPHLLIHQLMAINIYGILEMVR
jgi:PKD repeat protein